MLKELIAKTRGVLCEALTMNVALGLLSLMTPPHPPRVRELPQAQRTAIAHAAGADFRTPPLPPLPPGSRLGQGPAASHGATFPRHSLEGGRAGSRLKRLEPTHTANNPRTSTGSHGEVSRSRRLPWHSIDEVFKVAHHGTYDA
jgi:hypothetical protein